MTKPAPFARQWQTDESVLSVCWNRSGTHAAAALLDGTTLLIGADSHRRCKTHKGSPLSFVQAGNANDFLSAGDDGRLLQLAPEADPVVLAEHAGKWLDHVASHESGLVAYAYDRSVQVLGRPEPLPQPSTVGGLAFSPNGKRLAVSHYNGLSLYWTNAKDNKPQTLLWKGSHLGIAWHPNGETVMTAMQENALHGWRLKDLGTEKGQLRMAGYPGKTHSFGFSARGKWLVTSGADHVICWPFAGSGPQGKPPLLLGLPGPTCSAVSPHPDDEMTAAGFANGQVVIALYEERLPIEILRPEGSAITSLAWSPDGRRLLAGREDGHVYLFTTESIMGAAQASLA